MRWENTLLAFEEDIKERSFIDWVEAHTTGFKPLHRYEGVFEITSDSIIFDGVDKKSGERLHLEIPFSDILDVFYGFDEVFKGREERAWPWNKPLRITFRSGDEIKRIYLFVNFHYETAIRTSDNKEVYDKLRNLILNKPNF